MAQGLLIIFMQIADNHPASEHQKKFKTKALNM